MMRLAFRGLTPRMLGTSGRRYRGGPTLHRPSYHTLAGSRPRRSDDLDPQLKGRNKRRFFEDRPCPGALGAALLRRRLFHLFMGVFARGRSLFGSFCAGTAPRTAPTGLFRAASPA